MTRNRRQALVSLWLMISDYRRRRRRALVLCRSRDPARKAALKRKPIVRIQIKNTPFKYRDEAQLVSDVSSGKLNKILDTMRRRQSGGKLILQLPRNKTTRKIPYSAWLDMLDDLRLWAPALTLPILTSSHLATFPFVVKPTDVIKLRPDGSEINLASLIWQLRKFPTIAGFKCTIVFG
jgi:hypothetical protein